MRWPLKQLLWVACGLLTASHFQVSAEQGDIIISREVQPRTATRAPMVPDPKPLVSNPGAIARDAAMELSDSDFASISTGATLKSLTNGPASTLPSHLEQTQTQHMPGVSSQRVGGAGGSNSHNAISNRVGSSLQQGLRPLQQLGGQ